MTFANPVPVTANTVYVASYFAPRGNYARDANFLASGVSSGPLYLLGNTEATANAQPGNAVYVYNNVSKFPMYSSGDAPNYWVDVLFKATP